MKNRFCAALLLAALAISLFTGCAADAARQLDAAEDAVDKAAEEDGPADHVIQQVYHQTDQHIQCGCCDWQDDLAPHVQRVSGPFHTGDRNAGHCRSHHAQRHQPGQHVFAADIKMCSLFHTRIL